MPQPGSVRPAKRRKALFAIVFGIIPSWYVMGLIGRRLGGQEFDGTGLVAVMVMFMGWEFWQQRRAERIGKLIRPRRWALGRSTREYVVAFAGFFLAVILSSTGTYLIQAVTTGDVPRVWGRPAGYLGFVNDALQLATCCIFLAYADARGRDPSLGRRHRRPPSTPSVLWGAVFAFWQALWLGLLLVACQKSLDVYDSGRKGLLWAGFFFLILFLLTSPVLTALNGILLRLAGGGEASARERA